MTIGRPTLLTPEMADAICNRLINGESLRSVCRDEAMPHQATAFRWIASNPKFREQYTRAKAEGCTAVAEHALDIADDGSNDWMESNDPANPGWRFNGEHVQRSRLRVETRKWFLSKSCPRFMGINLQWS